MQAILQLDSLGAKEDLRERMKDLFLCQPYQQHSLPQTQHLRYFSGCAAKKVEQMWSFFPEQGPLFLPQNSKANCIHELFVAWTSDYFTSLEGCNKTKVSSWKQLNYLNEESREVDFQNIEQQLNKHRKAKLGGVFSSWSWKESSMLKPESLSPKT